MQNNNQNFIFERNKLNKIKQNLLGFDDVLRYEKIDYFKILSLLTVQDSCHNELIKKFFENFYELIYDDSQNIQIKISKLNELIINGKNNNDCVFIIVLNLIEVIILENNIIDEKKIFSLKKVINIFKFIFIKKNESGRVYYKEERLIKTMSRLAKILIPIDKDLPENLDLSIEIKKKIFYILQNFLLSNLNDAKIIFNAIKNNDYSNNLIYDQEKIFNFNNNDILFLKNDINVKRLFSILIDNNIILRSKVEFLLIIMANLKYEIAIPMILGILYYSSSNLKGDDNICEEINNSINFYRNLYKQKIIDNKTGFEISNIGRKAKFFKDQAKVEIKIAKERLSISDNTLEKYKQ